MAHLPRETCRARGSVTSPFARSYSSVITPAPSGSPLSRPHRGMRPIANPRRCVSQSGVRGDATMVTKKSKLPAGAIELYNVYIHGGMSRRDFLDGAQKLAVGGLTAAAIVEGLLPNYAEAQQVPKDDKRLKTETATVPSPQGNGSIKGYLARPTSASGKLPGILVIRTESRSDGS